MTYQTTRKRPVKTLAVNREDLSAILDHIPHSLVYKHYWHGKKGYIIFYDEGEPLDIPEKFFGTYTIEQENIFGVKYVEEKEEPLMPFDAERLAKKVSSYIKEDIQENIIEKPKKDLTKFNEAVVDVLEEKMSDPAWKNRFGLWHTHTLEDELTDLEEKLEEKEPYIRPKTIEMPPTFTLDETESEADLIVRWIPYDEKEIIPEHILLISIGSKGTNWLKGRVLPNIRAIKDRHEIYGGFELGFFGKAWLPTTMGDFITFAAKRDGINLHQTFWSIVSEREKSNLMGNDVNF